MALPLQVIEGIFCERDGACVVTRPGEADINVNDVLAEFVGRLVEINLHHFPLDINKAAPGGGSCLWHGHCPHGHQERPGWLFHQKLSGTLTLTDTHEWDVGGTLLDLSKMPGHQGRLVLLDEDAIKPPEPGDQRSTEDLLREAQAMVDLLTGFQKVVKP